MPARFVEITELGGGRFSVIPANWTTQWDHALFNPPPVPSGTPLYVMATSVALYVAHMVLWEVLSRKYARAHGHAHVD